MLNIKRLPVGISLLNWNTELPSSGTGDPLGMTLRVGARLGAELLHCITSITPRARYYSFFPWAFQRAQNRMGAAPHFKQVMRHVLVDERAMALGAVLHHGGSTCDGGSLQGSNRAIDLATTQTKGSIDLGKWQHLSDDASGFAAYKGSLINLGMFEEGQAAETEEGQAEDEQSAALTSGELSARGRELAEAFDRAVTKTHFVSLDLEDPIIAINVIKEFGGAAGLCELRCADDFDLPPLRDLFFAVGGGQLNSHHRRRMSLGLLLWAVDITHAAGLELTARSFNDLTFYRVLFGEEDRSNAVEIPAALADISERWRIFHFHNYLTTALESLLAGLVRAIRYYPAGRSVAEILETFDSSEARSSFGDFLSIELTTPFMDLTPTASLALLGIDAEAARDGSVKLAEIFAANPFVERTLRDALIEGDFVRGPAGPAIAVLLIFTILLRYDLAVADAHKGWNAKKVVHPFSDVAIPTVAHALVTELGKDWWHMTNREVIARLLNRFVIRQHETMSYERGFGGSPPLFRIDGTMIVGMDTVRDEVDPGNPRFPSAMQILKDLRLIADVPEEGETLTPDGKAMLTSLLEEGIQ